jgi:hypothetical protein
MRLVRSFAPARCHRRSPARSPPPITSAVVPPHSNPSHRPHSPCSGGLRPAEHARSLLLVAPPDPRRGKWYCGSPLSQSRPAAPSPHRHGACPKPCSSSPPRPGLPVPVARPQLLRHRRSAADPVPGLVAGTPYSGRWRCRSAARSSGARSRAGTAKRSFPPPERLHRNTEPEAARRSLHRPSQKWVCDAACHRHGRITPGCFGVRFPFTPGKRCGLPLAGALRFL